MDIDYSQYMGMYIDGARENLDLMDKNLLLFEQDSSNLEIIGEIFRAAHTLKGMSATMGFEKIAHLTHEMESVLDKLRNQELEADESIIDTIFDTFDILRQLVNDSIEATDSVIDLDEITGRLRLLTGGATEGMPTINERPASKEEEKKEPEETSKSLSVERVQKPDSSRPSLSVIREALAVFDINDFESQVILETFQNGQNVLFFHITLDDDCFLKVARVFMVNRAISEFGYENIKSVPSAKDIEDENFDLDFKLLMIGSGDPQELQEAIKEITEIESAKMIVLTPDDFKAAFASSAEPEEKKKESLEPAEKKVSEKSKERRSAEAAPSVSAPVKPAPVKSLEKPADKKEAPPPRQRQQVQIAQTVRVDMRRLDELMNLVGELVINRTRLEDIGMTHKLKELNETILRVSQISTSLQTVVMEVRMVPIEQVFDRFPRMVRDLSKKLNKKINLVIEGKETEMDRTVIDEIGDPMVHLIRNSVDHGIELPEERVAKGKPETGTVTLSARHEGNSVLIEIADDGKGVDPTIIGKKAVEKGMFTQEQIAKMPPEEIQQIIFMQGFSTSSQVSDISGRGVGMDAVRAKLEELNGVMLLESKVNEGSKITVKLPLTLAILPALMVRVGKEVFAIPLASIQENMDIDKKDISVVQHQEVILMRGDVLPIMHLRKLLDVPTTPEEQKALDEQETEIPVVVCVSGNKMAGLIVDELLGQQEIVIKSLGGLLSGVPGLMGATMRGDGSIALILDISAFF
ncbi:MAG: chemotaxis protein CheA [Candidatus Riflebacteria bacterium]|nr:chemotaxis protein CheA [Candidatus Riflebacteria bacterium]